MLFVDGYQDSDEELVEQLSLDDIPSAPTTDSEDNKETEEDD